MQYIRKSYHFQVIAIAGAIFADIFSLSYQHQLTQKTVENLYGFPPFFVLFWKFWQQKPYFLAI